MTQPVFIKRLVMIGLIGFSGLFFHVFVYAADLVVYGYFDLGYIRESGKDLRLGRGQNNWLGFKGREDIGNGTHVTFNLQTRFDPVTGEAERASTFWQGETTVGFDNPDIGTFRFGRAMTPLWEEKWPFDPWYDSALMGSLANYNGDFDSDGLDPHGDFSNYCRVSSATFYSSPVMAGFQLHASMETEMPDGADSRSAGLSLNYGNGPLAAMLAVERNHLSDEIVYVAGSYNIDQWTALAAYSHTDFSTQSAVNKGMSNKRSIMLAGIYAFGMDKIRFGYGRIRENGDYKYTAGYNMGLSKRTNIYLDVYREYLAYDDDHINGIAVGMNHSF